MTHRYDVVRFEKVSAKVLCCGFFSPVIFVALVHLFWGGEVHGLLFEGGGIFGVLFPGVVNAILRYSMIPDLQLSAFSMSLCGVPLWSLYWFFLGPKKIESGSISLRVLLKFPFWLIVLILIYLIVCVLDSGANGTPKSIRVDKAIANPVFFYIFILSPIYFFSWCVAIYIRILLIYFRR